MMAIRVSFTEFQNTDIHDKRHSKFEELVNNVKTSAWNIELYNSLFVYAA